MTQTYDDPRMAINRVYTRQGDRGETSLAGGQRIPKDAARIEAYGTVDELNAFIGEARISALEHEATRPLGVILLRVQHELFNLGSLLATMPQDLHPNQARVTDVEAKRLEAEMDQMGERLPALRSFLLPGGSRLNAELHVCRTVCRRAERLCVALVREEGLDSEPVRYLNRLSDAFFVWSRWASHVAGVPEVLWDPNEAASAHGSRQPETSA